MPRKSRSSPQGYRRWWPGALLLVGAGAALLYFTAQPQPIPAPRAPAPAKPAPPPAVSSVPLHTASEALGQYGASVSIHGQPMALTIQPVLSLQGSGSTTLPHLRRSELAQIITNRLLSFPDLATLATDPTVQTRFTQALLAELAPMVTQKHPGWRVTGLQIHPHLGPIPNQ